MSLLKQSWSSFSREIAKIYLNGYGHPSERSKALTASVLRELFADRPFRLADFGCGNGQIFECLQSQGLSCAYSGYDFSTPLVGAGRERHAGTERVQFIEADIEDINTNVAESDVVLYSHVLEMLQSPERSLLLARKAAPLIMIRFFEPPVADHDMTEVRQLDTGGDRQVPYLRRTMSREYYNLLLNKIGCRSVEIHQVQGDKDQVHVLRLN
jgi:SAM-dependent methyltransferase